MILQPFLERLPARQYTGEPTEDMNVLYPVGRMRD